MSTLSRRAFLASGIAACLGKASRVDAMGRVPVGGELRMRLPWSTRRLDPHDLFDPLAAIFSGAVADPAYARDGAGTVYPTLADGMPRIEDGQTVVRMRAGLVSAAGKTIGGRDLAWSVTRARNMGAAGLLGPLDPFVRSDPKDPLIARFGQIDPGKLALLLSSPLVAVLPVGFAPEAPDGTGPFRATPSPSKMELVRNANASRGPSQLDRVVVHAATDMADSLRAFEAGQDDVGWLGLGLHRDRAGARKFGYGEVAWVVLVTGKRAGAFGAAGVAQQLANGVPVERLHLGLDARSDVRGGSSWHGDPADVLYDGGHGQLATVARAVASKLSERGHELTARAVSTEALRRARDRGDFSLAIDVVRHPHGGPTGPLIALATADKKALGRDTGSKPPNLRYDQPLSHATTMLQLGILGGLGVHGGVVASVLLAPDRSGRGVDWGGSYKSA